MQFFRHPQRISINQTPRKHLFLDFAFYFPSNTVHHAAHLTIFTSQQYQWSNARLYNICSLKSSRSAETVSRVTKSFDEITMKRSIFSNGPDRTRNDMYNKLTRKSHRQTRLHHVERRKYRQKVGYHIPRLRHVRARARYVYAVQYSPV